MNIFDYIVDLFTFKKKSDLEIEEDIVDQLVKEEESEIEESADETPVSVVMYTPDPNDNNNPVFNILIDDFVNDMLPDKGSIIWTNVDETLRPFKVVRNDYVQNGSEYDSMRVYIVVEAATYSDVIPNPKYNY